MSRLPISHPRFNLREIVKQFTLLEDHLQHPHKQCLDCIRKHLLMSEALAEEMGGLDVSGDYQILSYQLTEKCKGWLEAVSEEVPLPVIAQEIRAVRKHMAPYVADPRGSVQRVASRYVASSFTCSH